MAQTVYSPLQKLISMIKHVYLSYEKIIPNKYGIKRLNCSQEFRVKVDLDRVFQISRKLPDHKRYIAWCTKNKSNRRKNTQFWIKLRFSKFNLVNMIKSPKQFQTDDLQFTSLINTSTTELWWSIFKFSVTERYKYIYKKLNFPGWVGLTRPPSPF